MNKLLDEQRGLTLIEILVAMMLLSVIIITSMTLLANGIGISDGNNNSNSTLNLAEEKLEYWKYNIIVPDNWEGELITLEPETSFVRGNKTYKSIVTAEEYSVSVPGVRSDTVFAEITSKVWITDPNNSEAVLRTLVKVNPGT